MKYAFFLLFLLLSSLSAHAESDVVLESRLFALDEPTSSHSKDSVTGSACVVQGEQKIALILVQAPGTLPPAQTLAYHQDLVFGANRASVADYFRENSYGKFSITGDTYGWFTLPFHPGCSFDKMIEATYLATQGKVDWSQYGRIAVVGSGITGCSFSGQSTLGCKSIRMPDGKIFVGSFSWGQESYMVPEMDQGRRTLIMAHELGHALGWNHGRYRGNKATVTGHPELFVSEAVGPDDHSWPGSVSLEYGNQYTIMGNASTVHSNTAHKAQLGWINNYANRETLPGPYYLEVTQDGDFDVEPMALAAGVSGSTGIKALKIRRGSSSYFYWVEYRQKIGFDSNLLDQAKTLNSALVLYQDGLTGVFSDLVDMRSGDFMAIESTLPVGQVFSDPYVDNFSILPVEGNSSRLRVRVNRTQPVCSAFPTTALLTLGKQIANPKDKVAFAHVLKNNNSSSCPAASIQLEAVAPTGWTTAFSDAHPMVPSRAIAAVDLSFEVPAKTPAVSYPMTTSSRIGDQITTSMSAVTVTPYTLALTAMPQGTVSVGGSVSLTATVLKAKKQTPVDKTVVSFSIKADGQASGTSMTCVTSATGRCSVSWSPQKIGHFSVTGVGSVKGGPVKSMNGLGFAVQ